MEQREDWYRLRANEVEAATSSNFLRGLSVDEVDKRREQNGWNELKAKKKTSRMKVFLSQFNDFMVFVLLGATAISAVLGEVVDAIAILLIILINGILGYIQENKAEESLNALKALSSPLVSVKRENEWVRLPARELVHGDVVKFQSGDRVAADLRIIEASSLSVEESALTGESLPVNKNASAIAGVDVTLADQDNMAFMGTLVTRGHGVGVVISIGMQTAMGQIASLIQDADEGETPLQLRLSHLGKVLIVVAFFLTLIVVVLGVYQGQELYRMFLAGVSLAVAAIPEGLPAIVTVALSLGVQRMIKRNAIVRRLPSVETLGCTNVICSDKTGTMTENKMMVTAIWTNGEMTHVTGEGYAPTGIFSRNEREVKLQNEQAITQLLAFGYLCNNAEINKKEKTYTLDGDPTEGALVCAAQKAGLTRNSLRANFTILQEFPFDSARKMMSVLVKDSYGRTLVITKGAPDIIVERCVSLWLSSRVQSLNEVFQKRIDTANNSMTSNALRTIAIAYREVGANEKVNSAQDAERNLIYLGIQGMIDPPRKEVAPAIAECRAAGIRTVMITGDHVRTAEAIAKEIGLLSEGGLVLEGKQLDLLADDEFQKIVDEVYVFARVTPEHKLKIVRTLQSLGHIVAMTGDGINDAPAIKQADIGIAMGITGTDVAKEASSVILLDDNFSTIKSAIKEGRNIYENIRKFIRYLLASNVGEILVMLFAMLLGLPLPLLPVQILWVNLVTDGLPAMALGLDKAESNLMNTPPRTSREGIFARGMTSRIITRGFLIGLITLIAFIIMNNQYPDDLQYAQTVAFTTLVFSQLLIVFDCRSEHSVIHRNPFGNLYLVGAVLISVLLMLVVLYYPPLQEIFHTETIHNKDWLLILGLAGIPTFLLAGFGLSSKKA
ncbi:MAG: cation-translocating P-type ATPase [Bacilli bacterium]